MVELLVNFVIDIMDGNLIKTLLSGLQRNCMSVRAFKFVVVCVYVRFRKLIDHGHTLFFPGPQLFILLGRLVF